MSAHKSWVITNRSIAWTVVSWAIGGPIDEMDDISTARQENRRWKELRSRRKSISYTGNWWSDDCIDERMTGKNSSFGAQSMIGPSSFCQGSVHRSNKCEISVMLMSGELEFLGRQASLSSENSCYLVARQTSRKISSNVGDNVDGVNRLSSSIVCHRHYIHQQWNASGCWPELKLGQYSSFLVLVNFQS